jgi:HlyD family secretion protein
MNAEVEVDENDIVLVKVGDTARIEVDALPDKVYNGVVIEIGHSAILSQQGTQDQVTNFKVKVRIVDKEARLRPGMSCNVDIETQTRRNVLSIPLQSVTVRDLKTGSQPKTEEPGSSGDIEKISDDSRKQKAERPPSVVFVKNGIKAKMVKVKTGISDNGYIEVIEGLKEGDEIISGSYMAISKELQDGSMIKTDTSAKKKRGDKKTAGL